VRLRKGADLIAIAILHWPKVACGAFGGHYYVDRRQKAWFFARPA
jgi:hypothetical protein